MSSFIAQARSRALRPMAGMPRPRLTVVAKAAQRAPRIPFVVLVVTLLVGGLVGLLLLNTALQRGAYTTTALRDRAAALTVRQQQLEVHVDAMAEPQRLAQRALHLGMVGDASPGFLDLASRRIVGAPAAGKQSDRVDVTDVVRHRPSQSGKIALTPAGSANSLSSGPVVVPDPTKGRDRHADGGGQPTGSGTEPGVQYGGEDQGPNR
jgi:hypothetical protein